MSTSLEKEFQFFLDNRADLVKKYKGKVIVIRDRAVVGVFETEPEAVAESQKKFELGTFLVQKCAEDKESYSHTFRSRVRFA